MTAKFSNLLLCLGLFAIGCAQPPHAQVNENPETIVQGRGQTLQGGEDILTDMGEATNKTLLPALKLLQANLSTLPVCEYDTRIEDVEGCKTFIAEAIPKWTSFIENSLVMDTVENQPEELGSDIVLVAYTDPSSGPVYFIKNEAKRLLKESVHEFFKVLLHEITHRISIGGEKLKDENGGRAKIDVHTHAVIKFIEDARFELTHLMDLEMGLLTKTGYSFDWGGKKEKWLEGKHNWYYILESGDVYQQTKTGTVEGIRIGTLSPLYYRFPRLLHDADSLALNIEDLSAKKAAYLDEKYSIVSAGSLNYWGWNEYWLKTNTVFNGATVWLIIKPDGTVIRYDYVSGTNRRQMELFQLSPAYHQNTSLIVDAYAN